MKDILQVVGMTVAIVYIVGVLGALAWMRHVKRAYLGLDRRGRRYVAQRPFDRPAHEHTAFCLDQRGRDCLGRIDTDVES